MISLSVTIGGEVYVGESCNTEKEAQESVCRVAVQKILNAVFSYLFKAFKSNEKSNNFFAERSKCCQLAFVTEKFIFRYR